MFISLPENTRTNVSLLLRVFWVVTGIELVGPSKRTYTGMFTHLFYAGGVVSLAGIAYLIRKWQYLQIAITAPLIVFYFLWW